MKFTRALPLLIAALLASAGAFGRGIEPVVNFENVQTAADGGKPLGAEEIRKAINAAAGKRGWTVDGAGSDKLRATLNVRSHAISVDIGYTPASYSIRYADSTNMKYELDATGPRIHPSYNVWVKQLKQAIDAALLSADAAEPSQSTEVPKAAEAATIAAGAKAVRMGVAMTAVPGISSQVPGANCLLCLAAAHATVSTLKGHLETLPSDDLLKAKAEVAELLRKKGLEVVVVAEELDLKVLPDFPDSDAKNAKTAKKDFSSLRQKYDIDKLLVIEVVNLGVIRNFSAYIPRSDPKAVINISSYIVNLSDNAYDVRRPVNIIKAAEGNWDEPPKFPGMTNAYFQTLELARDQLLKAFEN